ncbi:MAG: glycosyltransferase family 4 protein [Anaerolineales bacterium]|nr:glycosyltransferase family 4 protein [Anaerolineales bacterium]
MADTKPEFSSYPEKSPPKTLIVDLSMKYGGSTSRVLSQLSRFPKEQVALAGLAESAITREAQKLDLPVYIVGRRKFDPLIIRRLIHIIKNEGFQVLDSQNIQSKFFASLASTFTRTALVSTINSWYSSEHGGSSIKGWIYTALELATNWNLSLYITVSEKDRQALLRSGLEAGNIELIYNAVNVEKKDLRGYGWLHRRLNLPAERLLCTAVGRLVAIKGYDVLVDAAMQACQEIPLLTCVIIGEGNMRGELVDHIQKANLVGRVILAGYFDRNDVLAALKSSDIFVMPSRYEGTPIALLEAAALACPILASATGGIPELVINGEHALLVPPDNSSALAEGIVRLCKDRDFANYLGSKAQKYINTKFNLESQTAATLHAYQKAWSIHHQKRLNVFK